MKFKKSIFGFIDMIRFSKITDVRAKHLAQGSDKPLPKTYRTNELAKELHPGYMKVELIDIKKLTSTMKEFTFKRVDHNKFPFFKAGQYVSLQAKIGESLVSRPYSIASSPHEAFKNILKLGIQKEGYFSTYMCEKAKIGDTFVMSEPTGEFKFESLRDHHHIVCVAGGSGITPFISMGNALIDKDEDYEMTLIYGVKNISLIAYKDTLEKFKKYGINVVLVLSDEEKEGYEHGFINAKLLEKYVDIHNVTFFMCGPEIMYQFVKKELEPYDLPIKAIHQDASCCPDLDIKNPKIYKLTVKMQDQVYVIDAKENETLLVSMERAGINAPNKCRAGGCGWCNSICIKGEYLVAQNRDKRRAADIKFNHIHPCITYPKSDMEIEVPLAY